jgi:hypothetical protein
MLKKIFHKIIAARQIQANFQVAQFLQRTEYPYESVEHVYTKLYGKETP